MGFLQSAVFYHPSRCQELSEKVICTLGSFGQPLKEGERLSSPVSQACQKFSQISRTLTPLAFERNV